MNDIPDSKKKVILSPELYKRNPLWFKGAIAYRLLRIMAPKPLTRRLPRVLRQPLLFPGYSFPPGWVLGDILPGGVVLPEGVFFPPGWIPGDPLPDGTVIDTSMYFPETWQPGDELPSSLVPPPVGTLPPEWLPGDKLPDGTIIDTDAVFPPTWSPGDPIVDIVIVPPGIPIPPNWRPGDDLPVGWEIDTGKAFPDLWSPGDPVLDWIHFPPPTELPPDWKPGDDLPKGWGINTKDLFPEGWQPGEQDPEGTMPPPISYSDRPDIDSPIPPTYTGPGETAGPIAPPKTTPSSEITALMWIFKTGYSAPNIFDEAEIFTGQEVPLSFVNGGGSYDLKRLRLTADDIRCTNIEFYDGSWQQVFSVAEWTGIWPNWHLVPLYLVDVNGLIDVEPAGTWHQGFRPTHIRVTLTAD